MHPRAHELARLLLERGADPHDGQVLYNVFADNTSRHLLNEDIVWLLDLMYEHSLRRGHGADWQDPAWPMFDMRGAPSLGHDDRRYPGARFILEAAVDRNLLGLAEWMLRHGAGPNTPAGSLWGGSSRTLHQEALVRGHTEMAALLVRYGAIPTALHLEGLDAFIEACLALDRDRVQARLRCDTSEGRAIRWEGCAMPVIRIGLWIVLLVTAMLLPFLPGRHDPLATTLSVAATVVAFGGLLLVPIGVVWLASVRGYAPAKGALIAAAIVATGAAVVVSASGSLAAGALILVMSVTWLTHLRRRAASAQTSGAILPRSVAVALVVVPLAATAARMTLVESAAAWSRDHAIANATEVIRDIERFRERTGAYPVAVNSVWPDYHPGIIGIDRYRYEPNGDAYNLYFEHPSSDIAAREIVMYNPQGLQDFSSHAFDLLQLSPEHIRRQRGYFASEGLKQAQWKRFLFD